MAVEKVSIKFDEDALTLGDLEDFEEAAGLPLFEALKPTNVRDDEGNLVRDEKGRPHQEVKMTAKSLKALVWITLRADRPGFTLEDTRNIVVSSLEFVGDADAEGNDDTEAETTEATA